MSKYSLQHGAFAHTEKYAIKGLNRYQLSNLERNLLKPEKEVLGKRLKL